MNIRTTQDMEVPDTDDAIQVYGYNYPDGWLYKEEVLTIAKNYTRCLEKGKILLFPKLPFQLSKENLAFLLSGEIHQSEKSKNISYRPKSNHLKGVRHMPKDIQVHLCQVMQEYSKNVVQFCRSFLLPYASHLQLDYSSYRPLEESGRNLPLHKRNDLLHIDAFPTRPTHGGRILRIFTNIHPTQDRIWNISTRFQELIKQYSTETGLESFSSSNWIYQLRKQLSRWGMIKYHSAYDKIMLRLHDFLKENQSFQKHTAQTQIAFPPGSTWLVFTETVPHAVISGQFALEQTFIIPPEACVEPATVPIRIMEKMLEQVTKIKLN